MRRLIFLAAALLAASANAQTTTDYGNRVIIGTLELGGSTSLNWNGPAQLTITATGASANALIARTAGTQDIPIVAWSQSGGPASLATQDTHFENPAFVVYRSGTAGDTTTSATMLVQAGLETTGTTPVLQVGGCLALTGDNWFIVWGDGALSLPGGILDNHGKTHGKISIDPVYRQLVGPDGVTPVLSWSGTGVTITPGAAPLSPTEGNIYYDASAHHFYGWTGSAWKQLDN